MTQRTDEQPQFGKDTEETEVLTASSLRSPQNTTEDITQPTRVISANYYSSSQEGSITDTTEVLSVSDRTQILPGAENTRLLQQTRIQPQQPTSQNPISASYPNPSIPQGAHTTPAPITSASEERENTRSLRLINMRRTRPTTWAMIQHIFALLISGGLLIASLWFFLYTPLGQQLDEDSFNEFSYQFMNLQSQTSNLLNLIPAAVGVIAVIGLLFILVWKHRFVPALVGIAVALAANGSTQILKNYALTKPNYGIQEALMNSAPSGHTTFAAAAGAALFLASPKKLRPTVAALGALFALSAGFSTIINGWHRPVDVVSAILLTQMWTIVGLAILRFMRSEELDMSNTRNSGLILVPLLSIAGFFLVFCALALYAVTAFDPISGGALMAAACLILAVSAFTTSTQIALLRSQNKVRSAYTKVWTY